MDQSLPLGGTSERHPYKYMFRVVRKWLLRSDWLYFVGHPRAPVGGIYNPHWEVNLAPSGTLPAVLKACVPHVFSHHDNRLGAYW